MMLMNEGLWPMAIYLQHANALVSIEHFWPYLFAYHLLRCVEKYC